MAAFPWRYSPRTAYVPLAWTLRLHTAACLVCWASFAFLEVMHSGLTVQRVQCPLAVHCYHDLDENAQVVVALRVAAPYLCTIADATRAGRGPSHSSFHVINAVELVRLEPVDKEKHGYSRMSERELADEREFVDMMKTVLQSKTFYFANNYEITHTAQRTCRLDLLMRFATRAP